MSRVFLGFGGNLGTPLQAFRTARRNLSEHPHITVLAQSPLYRAPAVGGPAGQPDYLNGVLEIDSDLTPEQLLDFCQTLETAAGRNRDVEGRWGARPLDIDLLLFADLILETPQLKLPHPRLHQRHFVLLPLTDLAPRLEHPVLKKKIAELLHQLPTAEGINQLNENWEDDD